MKHRPQPRQQSLYDDYVVRRLVPEDHPLLQIDQAVDFSFVRALVADLYSPDTGRQAVDPELLLRLCFLQQYYALSDREVMARAQTDLALRAFLHLDLEEALPHPSLLSVFRTRLGAERFEEIFNRSVAVAVERGLVQGRLLIVDSYGIVADIAVPRLRRLLMRLVERGLKALAQWGAETGELAAERKGLAEDTSWWQSKELRERDVGAWFGLAQRVQAAVAGAEVGAGQERVRSQVGGLLAKALQRQAQPQGSGRRDLLVSDVDGDARWTQRERKKKVFVGYKEQVATDAAHEIITAAAVTPANVDDQVMLAALLERHGANTEQKPQAVAGDSGYSSGSNRERLEEEEITDFVAVPTPKGHKQGQFSASDFAPEFDEEGTPVRVQCPAGQVAEGGKWDEPEQGWTFYLRQGQCAGCELRERCTKAKRGRTVFISRHWRRQEEARRRQAEEPEFAAAQIARLGIERTFAYQQERSALERAWYRGLARVRGQVFLCCFMVNVTRIVRAVQGRAGPGRKRKRR